jgi:hypothetical protein
MIRLSIRRRVLASVTERDLGIQLGGGVLRVQVGVRPVAELRDVAADRADLLPEVAGRV